MTRRLQPSAASVTAPKRGVRCHERRSRRVDAVDRAGRKASSIERAEAERAPAPGGGEPLSIVCERRARERTR